MNVRQRTEIHTRHYLRFWQSKLLSFIVQISNTLSVDKNLENIDSLMVSKIIWQMYPFID